MRVLHLGYGKCMPGWIKSERRHVAYGQCFDRPRACPPQVRGRSLLGRDSVVRSGAEADYSEGNGNSI